MGAAVEGIAPGVRRRATPASWRALLLLLAPAALLAACEPAPATTRDLYDRALRRMAEGKYAEARATFQQVVDAEPEGPLTPEALYKIASLYHLFEGQPQKALPFYAELAGAEKGSPLAFKAQASMAAIYRLQYRDFDGAIAEYRGLIERYGDVEDVSPYYLAIAESYMAKGDFGRARSEYARFVERFPRNPRAPAAAFQRAYTHYIEGKAETALAAMEDFAARTDSDALRLEAEFVRGQCLEDLDRPQEALAVFKAIREAYPYPQLVDGRIARIESGERDRLQRLARDRKKQG